MFNDSINLPNQKRLDISQLKKMTAEAKDLSEPFNYFFDIAEQPGILNQHRSVYRPERHPILNFVLAAVENVVNTVLKKNIKIKKGLFYEVPEHSFFHGSCILEGNSPPLTIIYFSDIQIGLVGYVDKNFKTELFRLSLAEQKPHQQVH